MATITVAQGCNARRQHYIQTAQEHCWSYTHKKRTTISVSPRSRSAGIIRVDTNTSNSILKLLKLQMETLIDLNSREDLSKEVRDIWGADRMHESIRKLVRVGADHIPRSVHPATPCFVVFSCSYNPEPRNMELVAKVGSGKYRGFTICRGRWAEAVVRMDTNVCTRPISVRPWYILQ